MRVKIRIYFLYFIISIALFSCHTKSLKEQFGVKTDYTQFVNPFIGTDGTGHTFPGPTMPFGMVQPGPDNVNTGWDYTSGYQLKDSTILGFSQTRASGTGISEFGDILLLPFVGDKKELKSKKIKEEAEVGFYSVLLDDSTQVELTATNRVALHRYTFPSNNNTKVLVDLQHGLRFITDSLVLENETNVENNHTISGYTHTKNWVERKYFFVIEFDRDFNEYTKLPKQPKEAAPRFILNFELGEAKQLRARIALSTVSVEGAKRNLEAELNHWDFELVHQDTKKEWNKYLSTIDIEAGQEQKEIFYTGMYHLFTQPNNIVDIDSKYRGANDSIAIAQNGEYFSTLSLWDTYRAAHPLYTIITPQKVDGFVQTMLAHHKAKGFLPIWTAWGQENFCMIGNHAIPVITDAYIKGFKGFDPNEALDAMVKSTSENHLNSDWQMYNKYGYYPYDLIDNESVSRTLESGFDDYCVGLLAEELGEKALAQTYYTRASYYKNLFDPSTNLMRGKSTKGKFRVPFDPIMPTSPMNNPGDYTEANAWQYSFASTQFDPEGLVDLVGGKEKFTKHLDKFFTIQGEGVSKHLGQEALIGQYAHGNEPSHHIAYLYAYSSEPHKSQDYIRQIYSQFYDNTPTGITGNDDCGQMSAWYIFSTLGFYPVNPANGEFIFGVPQVEKATINLPEGKTFIIENNKLQEGEYSSKITLNDSILDQIFIDYKDIMKGGTLKFE
ncbi:GH92 family glycosyl hydrolase [Sediminitomix flava]|uniref:Putative alpha-1,2-mannosidase n=1 Tax=Sediminitomix flava TaxID=379075 RepID=A0A315ZBT7_SEDFL|nr:GH92 family glycosyl hydrolase [Sediminitomix flava]PWJ42543.1 putative alpha-1,2-mannosidase [Sediminitomix flava]